MPAPLDPPTALTLDPIGIARTPWVERAQAPRQPRAAEGVEGTIELARGYEDAVADLEGWERIWVIFWFHLNTGWRPKVRPPRSGTKRGVLSTRSPHRPCPLGLSVLRLDSVDGLTLRVRDVDLLDGTPVLDIKPYLPWADAWPRSGTGWLEPLPAGQDAPTPPDAAPAWEVCFSAAARTQLAFLEGLGVELRERITATLTLGPRPHAYRRIRPDGDAMRLAVKDWRARFRVDGRRLEVLGLGSGYRPRELWGGDDDALAAHRAFETRFGRL